MQNTSAFDFPQEPILLVRPCLIVICRENRPAAKLLSGLLYHARNCPEDQETFVYQRKQGDLVKIDLCGEISVKTLHDVAIPTLKLLGFVDVDESSYVMRYTIHLSNIRQALASHKKGPEQLEKVLIGFIKRQLEKVLIQLEKVLIDKKNFQLLLEKFLIVVRKISNSRGRKASTQAVSEAPENKEITRDINRDNRESNDDASASHAHTPLTEKEVAIPTQEIEETLVEANALSEARTDSYSQPAPEATPETTLVSQGTVQQPSLGASGDYTNKTSTGELNVTVRDTAHSAVLPSASTVNTNAERTDAGGTKKDSDTKRTKGRGKAGKTEAAPAQATLPLAEQVWGPEVAVRIAEELRERPYTPSQRSDQVKACEEMFRKYRDLTEDAYRFAFKSWNDWSRRERSRPFSNVELMKKSPSSGEIRLQMELDKWQTLQERQAKRSQPTTPAVSATPDDPETKMVVWTRHKHVGTAFEHWYLYENMTLAEALKYGYQDNIIPSDRRGQVKRMLVSLANGQRKLSKEQQAEYDQAKGLVAI